jgi:hypothetical protein
MSTLRKFCSDFKLPDLTPLVAEVTPLQDRCAVVWQVMQARLSVDKQGEFLRRFCESSGYPVLEVFADGFLSGGLNKAICNKGMNVVRKMDGVDAKLADSMKVFCAANGLAGVVAFMDKFGLESVAYSIESVFRVAGEDIEHALDGLKFEANPIRFAEELDRMMVKRNAEFAAKIISLNAKLAELQALKADQESPPVSPVLGGGKRERDT